MPPEPPPEKYNPLALITVVLASLLLFSVFFLGFLVAPLAILTIFYVGFAASDRAKQRSTENAPPEPEPDPQYAEPVYVDQQDTAEERLAAEAAQRRAGMQG